MRLQRVAVLSGCTKEELPEQSGGRCNGGGCHELVAHQRPYEYPGYREDDAGEHEGGAASEAAERRPDHVPW